MYVMSICIYICQESQRHEAPVETLVAEKSTSGNTGTVVQDSHSPKQAGSV